MSELRGRVRERLQAQLLRTGASASLHDPALFADVAALLQRGAQAADGDALLLPELLGDPETWRLQTSLHYQSHRGAGPAAVIVFVKRRLLMPALRWLFEYSRDNFERQRRVNRVLFACIQELAVENARLRRQIGDTTRSGPSGPAPV